MFKGLPVYCVKGNKTIHTQYTFLNGLREHCVTENKTVKSKNVFFTLQPADWKPKPKLPPNYMLDSSHFSPVYDNQGRLANIPVTCQGRVSIQKNWKNQPQQNCQLGADLPNQNLRITEGFATFLAGPALMAVWSKVLPLTACCLLPVPGSNLMCGM